MTNCSHFFWSQEDTFHDSYYVLLESRCTTAPTFPNAQAKYGNITAEEGGTTEFECFTGELLSEMGLFVKHTPETVRHTKTELLGVQGIF